MEPTETEVNIQELSHQTLSANRAGMMLDFLCAICVAGRRGGGGGIVRKEKLSGGYSVNIVGFFERD